MLPASLHSGVLRYTNPNIMFPPTFDPADTLGVCQTHWVQRQKEKAMRHLPTDLEVLPSPLLLEQMERKAAQCQIKSFRRTSLMYSSPELMEKIMQMERDYEAANGATAAAEQSTPVLQLAAELPGGSECGLPIILASGPTDCVPGRIDSQPDSQPDSSSRRRRRRKRDASAQVNGGLGDTSASAHATEGPADASAPAHGTKGPAGASASAPVTEGPADTSAPSLQGFSESLVLVLVPESPDEGFEDEPPPDPVHVTEGFKEQLVHILASEPIDEGFEEEALPDPVFGEFKEQLFLVLVSEGSPDSVPVSGGPAGSASASEGSPGHVPEGPWAGCLHDQVLSAFLVSSGGCSLNSCWTPSLTHHSLTHHSLTANPVQFPRVPAWVRSAS
ncbi:hypothetical protein CRENBAI_022517 [Crenichthys baileyi]|uniref:Uncharacterized protein n=1 Tax=Crenichthys baileyi TaxID=28760 RepID=A0AAV9SN68_9TELE